LETGLGSHHFLTSSIRNRLLPKWELGGFVNIQGDIDILLIYLKVVTEIHRNSFTFGWPWNKLLAHHPEYLIRHC